VHTAIYHTNRKRKGYLQLVQNTLKCTNFNVNVKQIDGRPLCSAPQTLYPAQLWNCWLRLSIEWCRKLLGIMLSFHGDLRGYDLLIICRRGPLYCDSLKLFYFVYSYQFFVHRLRHSRYFIYKNSHIYRNKTAAQLEFSFHYPFMYCVNGKQNM